MGFTLTGTIVRVIFVLEQMFGVIKMMQVDKKGIKLVFMLLVISLSLMSGAILHAYAIGNQDELPAYDASALTGASHKTDTYGAFESADVIYTVDVCPGDTLWDIAAANKPKSESIRSYINKIKKANGLKNSDIRAGQILVLP